MNQSEKNDALGNKYQDMKDQISQGMEQNKQQFDKDNDALQNSDNKYLENIGNALENNDKGKLDQTTSDIKNESEKQPTN